MKYVHTLSDNDAFDAKVKESLSQIPSSFTVSVPTTIHDPIIESLTPPTSDGSEHDRSQVPNTSDLDNLPATPEKSLRPYDNILTPDHDADHEKGHIQISEAPLKISDELPYTVDKSPKFTESLPNKTSTPKTTNLSSHSSDLPLNTGALDSPIKTASPQNITSNEVRKLSPKALDLSPTMTKSHSEQETSAETIVSSVDEDGSKFLNEVEATVKTDEIENTTPQTGKNEGSEVIIPSGVPSHDANCTQNYGNKSSCPPSPDHDLVCDFIDEGKEIEPTEDINSVDTHANEQELDDSPEKVNKLVISDDISPNIMSDFPKESPPKSQSPKRERITLKILKKNLILPAVNPVPISTAASSTPTPALTTTISLKPTVVQVPKSSNISNLESAIPNSANIKQKSEKKLGKGAAISSRSDMAISSSMKSSEVIPDSTISSPKFKIAPILLSPSGKITSDSTCNEGTSRLTPDKDDRIASSDSSKSASVLSKNLVHDSSKDAKVAQSLNLLLPKNNHELKPMSPKITLTQKAVSPKLTLSQNMTSPKLVSAQNMVSPTLTMPQTLTPPSVTPAHNTVSPKLTITPNTVSPKFGSPQNNVSPKLTISQNKASPKRTASYVISPKLSIPHKAVSSKLPSSPKMTISPKIGSPQNLTKVNVFHNIPKSVSNNSYNHSIPKVSDVSSLTKATSDETSNNHQKQAGDLPNHENVSKQSCDNGVLVKQNLPGVTTLPTIYKVPYSTPLEGDTRPRKRAKIDYKAPSSGLALQQPFGRRDDNKLVFLKENESDEELSLKRISLQQQLLAEKGIKTSSPVKNFGKDAPNSGSSSLQSSQSDVTPASSSAVKDTSTATSLRVDNGGGRHDNSETIRSALKAKINQRKYTDINLDLPPPRYTPLMNSNHKCYVAQGCPGECVCSTAPMLFCTKCYHLSHSSCSNVLCSNCGALFKFG